MQTNGTEPPKLIPLTRWNDYHPHPPIGGLRHLVFHAQSNGFDKVIRRVGSRILLDESAYFSWVDEQSANHGRKKENGGLLKGRIKSSPPIPTLQKI